MGDTVSSASDYLFDLPPDRIETLSDDARVDRVHTLIAESHRIIDEAIETYVTRYGKELTATCVLYSGGNDSTVLAHMMTGRADCLAHINTGIGIPETEQFVEDTAKAWGIPLVVKTPPTSYRELVIERGFPGPAMHYKMYQRLKERGLIEVRREFVSNGRDQRVFFLAGRRRSESERRRFIAAHERRGSIVWASPLLPWTKWDLNTYRQMHEDTDRPVPTNPVSAKLHMSGECLCGAFAKPHELDEIDYWYPETAQVIRDLEAEVKAAGHPEPLCQWGWGSMHPIDPRQVRKSGMLCSGCDALFEVPDGDAS